jgi:hypothetical protein
MHLSIFYASLRSAVWKGIQILTIVISIVFVFFGTPCIQGVPKKSDTIEIISIVLKLLLNARDYTPGNLMNLYLHLSILKRFHFVQIF